MLATAPPFQSLLASKYALSEAACVASGDPPAGAAAAQLQEARLGARDAVRAPACGSVRARRGQDRRSPLRADSSAER
jgi:hypothetical protein